MPQGYITPQEVHHDMNHHRNRAGPLTFAVLAVIGIGLAVWGASGGSIPLTLAPLVVAVGCVIAAIRGWRGRDSAEHAKQPNLNE